MIDGPINGATFHDSYGFGNQRVRGNLTNCEFNRTSFPNALFQEIHIIKCVFAFMNFDGSTFMESCMFGCTFDETVSFKDCKGLSSVLGWSTCPGLLGNSSFLESVRTDDGFSSITFGEFIALDIVRCKFAKVFQILNPDFALPTSFVLAQVTLDNYDQVAQDLSKKAELNDQTRSDFFRASFPMVPLEPVTVSSNYL